MLLVVLTAVGQAADTADKHSAAASFTPEQEQFFQQQVLPLLKQHCWKCHGSRKSVKGGLRLASRADILKGGDLGPAVSLKNPAASLFLRALNYKDENLQMPPVGKLPAEQIEVLTRWVKMGLPFSVEIEPKSENSEASRVSRIVPPKVDDAAKNFWSFRTVTRPAVPKVNDLSWVKNPIDAFILARLEQEGLQPAPRTEKRELLRRVHYGMLGLPPAPEFTEKFAADDGPIPFADVVDELLASPHYGERWARHWLDVVRYGESNSFERDNPKPEVWRYRDYVINAFNSDKPYDQFVREQLAGDELETVTPETLIATGFYRLGQWDDESTDPPQARYDELDDIVTTTSQAFLGLTVNCARCHDHKLDPIPQRDYYRLLAFFHGMKPMSYQYKDSCLTPIAPIEEQEEYKRKVTTHEKEKAAALRLVQQIEEAVLVLMPEEDRKRAESDKAKRAELIKKYTAEMLTEEAQTRDAELRKKFGVLNARKIPDVDHALSIKEIGSKPPDTFVLIRGSAHAKGEPVNAGFLSVLSPPKPKISEPPADAQTSGRRIALARWIVSRENPLTARVIVNRLWQHHFGRGIVRSPNNFGFKGDPPTHPKLLDWLASELMANSWRLKHIQRLILNSNTYQMSSRANHEALTADPENQLFWRGNMRRLGAEELRDSALWVSGQLNLKMGGPSIYPKISKDVLQGQSKPGNNWTFSSPEEQVRRSVYVHIKRSLIFPLFASFDFADTETSCPVRFATTQSTQALTLLNGEFMNEVAQAFAERLAKEAGEDVDARVRHALRLALGRPPRATEVERGCTVIAKFQEEEGVSATQALRSFCLLVLNLNEFIYLD